MAATNPIQPDPDAKTSDDIEAAKLLGRQAKRASRKNRQVTKSNGSNVGGRSVSGGARARGGSF